MKKSKLKYKLLKALKVLIVPVILTLAGLLDNINNVLEKTGSEMKQNAVNKASIS